MKKLISVLLMLTLLLSLGLTACNSGGGDEQTTTTTTATQTPGEDQPLTAELTVAGNALSEYKIIYARSEYYVNGPKSFTTEWDFYKLIATRIRNKIYALTGIVLEVSKDVSVDPADKEILVGPTNREESDIYDKLDVYTYHNFVRNGKLVIGGGYDSSYLSDGIRTSYSWAATYHAFDFVLEYLEEQMAQGASKVDLVNGFELRGKCELKTVACIGDSITEGDKASDRNVTAWPAVLQRCLWQDYVVVNYGKCGKTMRNNMDRRYNACEQYRAASKYQQKFDLALIMLGTNDFLNDKSFSTADDQNFMDSADEIVTMLSKNNEDLKIGVMNCPMYYGSNTSSFEHVRDLQYQLYEDLKSEGRETFFFDMYTFTDTELTVSRYHSDKLHLVDAGYALVGHKLSSVVPAMFDGSWDSDNQQTNELEGGDEIALPPADISYLCRKSKSRAA